MPDEATLAKARHLLVVLPPGKGLEGPAVGTLKSVLERRKLKPEDLAKTPVTATLANGALCAWVRHDPARTAFERGTAMRKALAPLLEENPTELGIAVYGTPEARAAAAPLAAYAAWVNGAVLPARKKKNGAALASISLFGARADLDEARAVAEANVLCRELTALPPNELNPRAYRARLRTFAKSSGMGLAEYDLARLRRMGAGAFAAVAQGSAESDAAIVRLRYAPRGAKRNLALVGKGICFDTGGHNLKPARYMAGMHHDMNGSAVALGILHAASRMRLPARIDAWLAIAQNDIGPRAYRQSEVVTALNGTTIEIVHTDAEGRMVLADTLALAARDKPDVIVDFATLTGSMIHALGNRYSGVFATRPHLARLAVDAGEATGERVCLFPMDEDYESALESKVADIKQCTLDGEADHILASRFLARFISDTPWVHVDLAAATCTDGLGVVGTEITGFGVAWGAEFVRRLAAGE
ncbi:MAG TPA: leucyl aminopeptidase family protein [Burkholderiales bacterium]|nr:leucyl aminopeptidase family protein [Burkholderiales bacterium]